MTGSAAPARDLGAGVAVRRNLPLRGHSANRRNRITIRRGRATLPPMGSRTALPGTNMRSSTFDALTAARELEAAGVERAHAEAIADQPRTAAGADLDQLATKGDLAELRAELRMMRWAISFLAALMLAVAARLFGIV